MCRVFTKHYYYCRVVTMWSQIILCLCSAQFLLALQTGGLPGFFYGFQRLCLCRCGVSWSSDRLRSSRLMGGDAVAPHEFPWLAAVNIGHQVVPGSLVSDRHVVTAASPLYGVATYNVTVTLGAHDRCTGSGVNISVSSIILNPAYSPSNKDNDIALVQLRHVVAFSDFISPICMPFFDSRSSEQVVWTVGWLNNATSCPPRVATLPSLSEVSCYKSISDAKLASDKGCLGPVTAKSVLCKDDIGAPVMSRWSRASPYRLLGVVSTSSCDVTAPPLYTRVNDHAAWIYEHTRFDCQCF